jgi:hypothetical protein
MALFRKFGVNHAKDVTGLAESPFRQTEPSRPSRNAADILGTREKFHISGSETYQCP